LLGAVWELSGSVLGFLFTGSPLSLLWPKRDETLPALLLDWMRLASSPSCKTLCSEEEEEEWFLRSKAAADDWRRGKASPGGRPE